MQWTKILYITLFVAGCVPVSFSQNETSKEDSSRIEIIRLKINSNRGDFSPFLLGNKLYFTSGRVHRYGLVYIDADTTLELEDVFSAEKIDSINFKHPHYFSEKINTKYNDGPLCFDKSGDMLFITGNDKKRMLKDVEPLAIFMAKKINGHWEHPTTLPFCTGTNSYCHPALMKDGKTLLFSSNITGGYGGMDLYISKFENNNWSQPKNLGTKINGLDNETFPFVTEDDVLYFTSDRKTGLGGLDIYMLDLKDPIGNEVLLLPSPFNSTKDDFGVWVDSTGNSGYFSSNRSALGDDDIYYFKNKYPVFENCNTFKKPIYCYTFFEESSLAAEDSSGMTYEWDLGDGTKMRGLTVRHCFTSIGNYSIQLNIIDKSSGALFYNELSYDFSVVESKQLFINCNDTIATGKIIKIDAAKSIIPGFSIKELFWFFGDGKYSSGENAHHKYNTNGEYLIQLGVIAKNDFTGKTAKFCTQKKVLVKDSLWIQKHISSLTKTVWPPPHPVDSLYRVKEGDSINFRIHLGSSKVNIPTSSKVFADLKDVKKQKNKDIYQYTSGKVKKLSEVISYYHKAKEKGFKDAVAISFYGDSLVPHQEKSIKGEIIASGFNSPDVDTANILFTRTVLFDFNKSNINKSYFKSLDSICAMLKKNKKLELIILSSSDTVGTSAYNYKLSKKRAFSVQAFLNKKGIKKERLDIIPFGENIPPGHERRKNNVTSNRRVELLLVKNAK